MKKLVVLILSLCLILTMIPAFGVESTSLNDMDTAATNGVDVVIVLDHTGSMDKIGDRNDEYGFRIDAAAMLIGMLDMESSRVAIVPFAKSPIQNKVVGFTSLKTNDARLDLTKKLYNLGNTQGNTNIGVALLKAVKMLDERTDTTNAPMIVLLTDGGNEIASDAQMVTKGYKWDSRTGKVIEQTNVNYTTNDAKQYTTDAKNAAIIKGYPIYVIGLGKIPTEDKDVLVRIADETVGSDSESYQPVDKENAKNLPEYFMKVLAKRIGSSTSFEPSLEPVGQSGGKYQYKVMVPFLNQSFREVNIVLPIKVLQGNKTKDLIDANTIEVQKENGDRAAFSLVTNDSAKYATIKIENSGGVGPRFIYFSSQKQINAEDISFNVLYNYNVKLKTSLEAPQLGEEYYKADSLHINAQFVDADGNVHNDSFLYKDQSNNSWYQEWMNINATWELHQVVGASVSDTVIQQGEMTRGEDRFKADIDLSQYPNLMSGDYALRVKVEGAGLTRETEMSFHLENHSPRAATNETEYTVSDIMRNIPGVDDTFNNATGDISYDDLFMDQDGDTLTVTITQPYNGNGNAIKLTADNQAKKLTWTTITATNENKQKSGSDTFQLRITDDEHAELGMNINFSVKDAAADAQSEYCIKYKLEGDHSTENNDNQYKKNTEITISFWLEKQDGTEEKMDDDTLTQFGYKLLIDGSETDVEQNKGVLTAIYNTGDKKDDHVIKFVIGPQQCRFEEQVTIKVPNANKPKSSEPSGQQFEVVCDGEDVPSFLNFILGEVTDSQDPACQISASVLTDADNDILNYNVQLSDPEALSCDNMTPNKNETCTISFGRGSTGIFNYTYQATVTLKATEQSDGQTGEYVRIYVVTSLFNKMLTYALIAAIVLVILIILVMIIHKIRKPWTPKCNVVIKEDSSLYPSFETMMPHTQGKLNLNRLGVNGDIANSHGIDNLDMQAVQVLPVRHASNAVELYYKKLKDANLKLDIDGNELNANKRIRWEIGQTLSVTTGNGYVKVDLISEEGPLNNNSGEINWGNDSDDWNDANNDEFDGGSQKKSGKKAKKNDAPTNMDDAW